MGKVISIKEISDFCIKRDHYLHDYYFFDGYEVATDDGKYLVLIENEQNCCENWGYFSSNDNFEKYIGKELTGVYLTNTALNTQKFGELQRDYWLEDDQIQFVDFCFSDGDKLQLAVYNAHNGYYGHAICVMHDDQFMLDDGL